MKLYLFELGRFVLPQLPEGLPVVGYLIQTDEGKNILVDTGFPERFIEQPPAMPGATPSMRSQDYVVHRLADIGLTPAAIDQVVITHFDIDHAGNLMPFIEAEIVVQKRQYDVAHEGHPRFAATRDQWSNSQLRYRLIEGNYVLAPGVELLATDGHVPGHQSLLVHLAKMGPVLLTIDAILNHSMIDADTRPTDITADNDADARASTRKLMLLAQQANVSLIIYGHDSVQWSTLKQAPAYYD